MYKVVNLGATVQDTGEVRVQLLNRDLVKTASNEIQDFWATLTPNVDKAYIHVIAMSAWEFYGPNNNGDSFYEKDLREYHPSFLKDGNIFLHHVNKDPRKSAGKPIFSYYNEPMHRIELVLAADKHSPNAVEVLRRLNSGEQIYVSMGVNVPKDRCAICGNEAKTRAEYCDHLRYNMKKVLEDGRQVHAFNIPPFKFFDISLVNRPADRTAWALNKMASEDSATAEPSSAELGEQAMDRREKLAAISKLSDIVKYIDGDVVDIKDTETANRCEMLKKIRDSHAAIQWPSVDPSVLGDRSVSPGGMLGTIIISGSMPSLFESAHISGRHFLGDDFSPQTHVPEMIRALPRVLSLLQNNPSMMSSSINDIFSSYKGEEIPKSIVIKIVPAIKQRSILIRQLMPECELSKHAEDVSGVLRSYKAPALSPAEYESLLAAALDTAFNMPLGIGPAKMDAFKVQGDDGQIYTTTRWEIEKAQDRHKKKLLATRILGAALGMASIGAAAAGSKSGLSALASPALAIAAYKALTKKVDDGINKVKTMEGHEIPATTAFEAATRNLMKNAAEVWPASPIAIGLEYSVHS